MGMCNYKSLLPQSCSHYSKTEIRTRQECAATSTYCLSPAVGTHRQREELDRNVQLQVLIASVLHSVINIREKRWREELDRNVQLQVLIASVLLSVLTDGEIELYGNVQLQVLIALFLQSVLRDREKNQIGMCSYKSLLIAVGTHRPTVSLSQMERSRTRQECATTSPYCLSPAVITQRQREELDRNVQLQVLIASVLQLVLTDREKNQIRMCSYKSLLTQPYSRYSHRQECAAREELDRNVQLQVLIPSVIRNRENNQMQLKSLLPHSVRQMERRTRQECAATSPY